MYNVEALLSPFGKVEGKIAITINENDGDYLKELMDAPGMKYYEFFGVDDDDSNVCVNINKNFISIELDDGRKRIYYNDGTLKTM